tara:strand:- start:691 stop:816 length:126 start_codon:yes stop_codon:yes gene_type:complete
MFTNISTKNLIVMLTYPDEHGLNIIDEEAILNELDNREVVV